MSDRCRHLAIVFLFLLPVALPAFGEAKADPKDLSTRLSFDARGVEKDIGKFVAARSAPNGLVPSFLNSAPSLFSESDGQFHQRIYGKMGYVDDQAFTYDLALYTIGLLLNGETEQAEKILNALEKDFYLPKNGSYGLFNAYVVTSKIPRGDMEMGGDGDRIHAGPTLWVALAALNHMKLQRNTRYLEFVLDIMHWCRTELTYYRFPDGERGAISMGMGWGPPWFKIFSTEHNIDYFSVLQMLRQIYDESPENVRKIFANRNIDPAWLDDEMKHVGRWLREVAYNKEKGCFQAGVNMNGPDPTKILDGTSWGLGGVGPENYAAWGIDLEDLINHTEKYFLATYKLPNGRAVEGFDITDMEGYRRNRKPLVWFEGTGQQIIAYRELAKYYESRNEKEKARRANEKAVQFTEDMHAFSEFYGLRGGLPYMAIAPKQTEIVKTLFWEWEIPRGKSTDIWVGSASSTMWYLYCVHNFYNPMKWKD